MSKYFLSLVTERTSYDRDGALLTFESEKEAKDRLKDLNAIADFDEMRDLLDRLDSLDEIKEELPTVYDSYVRTWNKRWPDEEVQYDRDVLFEEIPSFMTCVEDGLLKYVYSSHLIVGKEIK